MEHLHDLVHPDLEHVGPAALRPRPRDPPLEREVGLGDARDLELLWPRGEDVDALGDAGQGGRREGVAGHVRAGVVVVHAVLAVAHVLADVGDLDGVYVQWL